MPSSNGLAAGQRAVDRALKLVGRPCVPRTCLFSIRSLYNGAGGPPTAYIGWLQTKYKHPGDMNPPIGAAVWWGGGAGHVAIVVGTGGQIVSTDWPRSGLWGKTTLKTMNDHWHKPYKGWSEDIGGVHAVTAAGGISGAATIGADGTLTGDLTNAALGIADPTGTLQLLYGAFTWANNPEHWTRILYVALGILLILFVAVRAGKDSIMEAVK